LPARPEKNSALSSGANSAAHKTPRSLEGFKPPTLGNRIRWLQKAGANSDTWESAGIFAAILVRKIPNSPEIFFLSAVSDANKYLK
jgi:hypothetical protein